MGRDRTYQAILPLRGKIINSEKNRINKVLSNNEIQAMITAIGTGHRRRVRRREAPLPPRDRDDGRRRRRLAHPHADPDVPVPADAGADRARPRLHRRARRSTRSSSATRSSTSRRTASSRSCWRASGSRRRRPRPRGQRGEAHRGALAPLHQGAAAVRGLLGPPALRLRRAGGRADDPPPPRRARDRAAVGPRAAPSPRSRPTATSSRCSAATTTASASAWSRRRRARRASIDVPIELLASPIYSHVRKAYARLTEVVGLPPFTVVVGKETRDRRDLRRPAREGARRREAGHPALPLQGPRRDERRRSSGRRRWIRRSDC